MNKEATIERRVGRRAFLLTSGAVILGGTIGTYVALKQRQPRTLFEKLRDELSDILQREPTLGKIEEVYCGSSAYAILTIRNLHQFDPEAEEREQQLQAERLEIIHTETIKYLETETDMQKKKEMIELAKKTVKVMIDSEMRFRAMKEQVSRTQNRIYTVLDHLIQRFERRVVIGIEGLSYGEPIPINKINNLRNDIKFDFYRVDAAHRAKLMNPTIGLTGLEEKDTLIAALQLAREKPEVLLQENLSDKLTKEFYELNTKRNLLAVKNIQRAPDESNADIGVLIFGKDHFQLVKPTIPELLKKDGVSYIDFNPSKD